MRILVVSDTHRHNENYFEAIKQEVDIDLVLHCGDIEGCELELKKAANVEVIMVAGNNDFFTILPKEIEITIGKYNALLCHGHMYHVAFDNEYLMREAKERGYTMVIYGHTHKPVVEFSGDIVLINPGSLSYPRQEGRSPSYIILEIDDRGEVEAKIKYITGK